MTKPNASTAHPLGEAAGSAVVLDLCGGSGAWSAPYREKGYDVRVISLPESDVRNYTPPENVHGILAAPPCTVWAGSGARWWRQRTQDELLEAMAVLAACLLLVAKTRPKWWALENPVGKMRVMLGAPRLIFQPSDYGDPYTKRTLLWGDFALPKLNRVPATEGSKMHLIPPSKDRPALRSVTPRGFALAFAEANP